MPSAFHFGWTRNAHKTIGTQNRLLETLIAKHLQMANMIKSADDVGLPLLSPNVYTLFIMNSYYDPAV